MSATTILERQVYSTAEATQLLGLRRDRVVGWLDGYTRGGKQYEPVIRESTTNEDIVTWGEFVELGYLREYRKAVSLQKLRPVIDGLRTEFNTPYPLATKRPFVYDKELVLRLQEDSGTPQNVAIVIRSGQEIMMTEQTMRFFKKVEFDDTEFSNVVRLRPAGATSQVVIDPLVRFGRPTVSGVATERLWELNDAGEKLEEIASAYSMELDSVRQAINYEEQVKMNKENATSWRMQDTAEPGLITN